MVIIQNYPDETTIDILIDDGTNREINIPVALISFGESIAIWDYLDSDNETLSNFMWASVTFEFKRTIENGNITELDL